MPQNFLVVTNAPTLQQLAEDYFTPGPSIAPDEIRGDSEVAFTIQPIIENTPGSASVYSRDYDASDTFAMGIGAIDQAPTGGTVGLQANGSTTGLTAIAYNVSAVALTTALNAAITAGGGGSATALCSVTLITAGNYLIVGTTNQAVASGFFAVTSNALLVPSSTASFYEQSLGSASTPYRIVLVLVQQAMCFAEASTPISDPDATLTTVQAGSSSPNANKIQNIAFSPGVYGGSIIVTATADSVIGTCGTITPNMGAAQLGAVLANHPNINYGSQDGTPNNIIVTLLAYGNFNVEFTDDLANDDANALAIASSDVLGPMGNSGTINYNTIELYLYSLTQTGDSFTLKRQIQRTRSSGEIRTIYLQDVTIYKNVLNINTAVPAPAPNYYTTTQSDTRYLRRNGNSSLLTGNTLTIDSGATLDALLGTASITTTGITGTTTNNNASAGKIGEYVQSLIASGSAISLTDSTAANVTSISLTAGDWDVEGNINLSFNGTTTTAEIGQIGTTSAAFTGDGTEVLSGLHFVTTSASNSISLPRKRMSLTGTTTVYMVAQCDFSAGTVDAYGAMTARRVR